MKPYQYIIPLIAACSAPCLLACEKESSPTEGAKVEVIDKNKPLEKHTVKADEDTTMSFVVPQQWRVIKRAEAIQIFPSMKNMAGLNLVVGRKSELPKNKPPTQGWGSSMNLQVRAVPPEMQGWPTTQKEMEDALAAGVKQYEGQKLGPDTYFKNCKVRVINGTTLLQAEVHTEKTKLHQGHFITIWCPNHMLSLTFRRSPEDKVAIEAFNMIIESLKVNCKWDDEPSP